MLLLLLLQGRGRGRNLRRDFKGGDKQQEDKGEGPQPRTRQTGNSFLELTDLSNGAFEEYYQNQVPAKRHSSLGYSSCLSMHYRLHGSIMLVLRSK